ncbi:hypothetical protein [Bradyrhizobium sp.]|uniref:hypothetical protein n=1 Tax=Bradyrhizobium sp. TaxID=376 RepID=UPI00263A2EB5|nr:hypothetical protein [Bradyrhizobium sp.]
MAQGKGDVTANSAVTSFTEDTALKTGQSVRKVRQDAYRGTEIGTAALSKVVGTSLDKGEELDALAVAVSSGRAATPSCRRTAIRPSGRIRDGA